MTVEFQLTEECINQEAEATLSPGQQLQTARKALGLSVADIAQQIYLTQKIIEDIEQDNYQAMANFAFARGYLRAYAHCVALNADRIIDAFNRLALDERSIEKPTWLDHAKLRNTHQKRVRWVSYLVVITSFCLLAVWWHGRASHGNKLATDAAKPALVAGQSQSATEQTGPLPLTVVSIDGVEGE